MDPTNLALSTSPTRRTNVLLNQVLYSISVFDSMSPYPQYVLVKPYLIQPVPQKVVHEYTGANVTLDCRASGFPKPVTKWWLLQSPDSDLSHFIKEPGLLVIEDAEAKDSGTYVCEHSNGMGSMIHSFNVHVGQSKSNHVKIFFINVNDIFLCKPSARPFFTNGAPLRYNITVVKGQDALFDCRGDDELRVHSLTLEFTTSGLLNYFFKALDDKFKECYDRRNTPAKIETASGRRRPTIFRTDLNYIQ